MSVYRPKAEITSVPMATTVDGFSPITCRLTWINRGLTKGSTVYVYLFFGFLQPDGSFQVSGYDDPTHGTIVWAIGTSSVVPATNSTKTDSIQSYAWNPAVSSLTLDVLAFISTKSAKGIYSDWGVGSRQIGLKYEDAQTVYSSRIAQKIFEDVLTVNRKTITPVEIQSLTVYVG